MSNQLALNGAQPSRPTRFASLWCENFSTGLATQRSPLRAASGSYLQNKFYGSKNDGLLDGANVEVSNRLTYVRRPGSSVYNSQTFPAIDSFYKFQLFNSKTEAIKVIADTATTVYDATGPSTKTAFFTKSAGAGQTYFQSVGNTLYFGDGVDQKKWIQSLLSWAPNTSFGAGDFIIDPNNNIQQAVGGFTVDVASVQIVDNVAWVTLNAQDPDLPYSLNFMVGAKVTFQGLVAANFLNGLTLTITGVDPNGQGQNVFSAAFSHPDYPDTPDAGTISSGTGQTGATQPSWNTALLGYTYDGGTQWVNRGNYVQNWGINTPVSAPTVSQAKLPKSYPEWAPSTYYSTSYLIRDPSNHIQMVTTFGTTGTIEPSWNDAGGTTQDGTVVWTDQGSGVYSAGMSVTAGQYIFATATDGNSYFFRAITGGTAGTAAPEFPDTLGLVVVDNNVEWQNAGVVAHWSDISTTSISDSFIIIPVQGGGSVAIGCGTGLPSGSTIALPAGFSSTNLLPWTTAGAGLGSQVSGVFSSWAPRGVVGSSMENRSGGYGFDVATNWAAVTWTPDANVTQTTSGGATYMSFKTALGADICIVSGNARQGSSISVPTGYLASQFVGIIGMATTDATDHGMQSMICSLDSSLAITAHYFDGSSEWLGSANYFGLFWKANQGIQTVSVTGGTAVTIPTFGVSQVCVIGGSVMNNTSFGVPAGFGGVTGTCSMRDQTGPAGSAVAHGMGRLDCTGTLYTGYYQDGSGFQFGWNGNIFAVGALLDSTPVSPNRTVNDDNGDLQQIATSGLSATTTPAWKLTRGSFTPDNTATWQNTGTFSAASTNYWSYVYAYKNLVDGSVSTSSPASKQLTLNAGYFVNLSGVYSTDPQVGSVMIFRTVQGGSLFLLVDEIPNNPAGGSWTYQDTKRDTDLNNLIVAPIDHANDPPPVGFGILTYHLGRIWGAVNNSVYFSGGPDTTTGNGNTAFPPANVFVFPDTVTKLYPTTTGLYVFTVSDVYVIQGTVTASFFSVPFLPGLGLPSYNAFDVNGGLAYLFTTDHQVVSLDLSAGVDEVGFPIGDQFLKGNWNAQTVRVSWHIAGSPDKGLYVSDGSSGWFRLYPTPSPESGRTWAPFASITNGVSAVKSVETAPGVHNLLIGPQTSGPILKRDDNVFTDNGQAYPAHFTLGSVVLAQPGQIAELVFFTIDSIAIGNRPSIWIQLDEISPYPGFFENLPNYVSDPAQLSPSQSLWGNRYYVSQTQQPALCRHFQMYMDWGMDTVQNELLSLTAFGSYNSE